MIENFLDIGFKLNKSQTTKSGLILEYSYYPDYLKDSHYTLVTYRSHLPARTLDGSTVDQGTDYRLYVHKNDTGEFVDGLFQLSDNSPSLEERFKQIFKGELINLNRKKQLNNLLIYENN